MFQFTALPPVSRYTVETVCVNSHSEILGSKAACASPKLITACHVLHRLLEPSHPLTGYRRNPTSGNQLDMLHFRAKLENKPHQAKPKFECKICNGQTLLTPRSNDHKLGSYTWQRVLRRALLTPTSEDSGVGFVLRTSHDEDAPPYVNSPQKCRPIKHDRTNLTRYQTITDLTFLTGCPLKVFTLSDYPHPRSRA